MEARGGNGYIDDWVDGKLLRDAQLGSIWEGTTSIVALDVQRALMRNTAGDPFFEEVEGRLAATAGHPLLGTATALLQRLSAELREGCAQLPDLAVEERELGAIDLMNRLYDLNAATLLLEQSASQLRSSGNHRKLAVLLGFLRVRVLRDAETLPNRARVLLGGAAQEILDSGYVPEQAVRPALDALAEAVGPTVPVFVVNEAQR